ncbi:phage major capsid protein, partial [Mesorhizobium sp. M7A.F.Ca.ET.027.03.2.1]|uniref:phage major capsid protein n=1 Tax=Mesorhizobium sp. M7A.F.Ca.ET.027.03.2.1 TaxID=2496656 RepID=UPI000FCC037F
MTFHSTNFPVLETKTAADDVDPIVEVKTALDALTADVNKKTAGVDKITERLDGIEAKLARPNIQTKKDDEPSVETKAFAEYLRMADRAPELKTLTVSSDPQGGYLAPAEMSAEFIRNLVEFSPIRAIASVRTTGNASVLYTKRNTCL